MQAVITSIVIICALIYAFWRIYEAFRNGGDPCKECELKKNCKKFGGIKGNYYLCTRLTKQGALDEWLSQRSAKPSTAVRIRQAPQSTN